MKGNKHLAKYICRYNEISKKFMTFLPSIPSPIMTTCLPYVWSQRTQPIFPWDSTSAITDDDGTPISCATTVVVRLLSSVSMYTLRPISFIITFTTTDASPLVQSISPITVSVYESMDTVMDVCPFFEVFHGIIGSR